MSWLHLNQRKVSFKLGADFRFALIVFVISRLFITLWAILVLVIIPLPQEPDNVLRPYLGEPDLRGGVAGLILGPWQRFDAQRYMRIARQGYAAEEDSVFPPLYPLASRGIGTLMGDAIPLGTRNLIAALLISNIAFLATLILLYRMTEAELNESAARRCLVYFTVFPTGFYLMGAYSESLFILFALGAVYAARRSRFWQSGGLGLLASLTRLTGWTLIVPIAYEYLDQKGFTGEKPLPWKSLKLDVLALFLPLAGFAAFVAWRELAGLPSLPDLYRDHWYQTTGIPGSDMITALRRILNGQAPFTLWFDFFITLLLLGATIQSFRKLGPTFGLYSVMLLLFMLLPTSQLKPLYSFSRYALAFFPLFMLFGQAGKNPWINRLILYPSLALYMWFSGQFFLWGWVA